MLDPAQPVSALPDVAVYRDDRQPQRFYAYPSAPRLARDPDGGPIISLLLYGRKTAGGFQLSGGYLNMTTSFALSVAEVDLLRLRLQALRRQEQKLASDAPVTVDLVAPAWTSGTVVVRLGADLELRGAPSLLGANEAALSLSLDADHARQLQHLWKEGLPDATICYDLQTEAARQERYTGTTEVFDNDSAAGSSRISSVQSIYDASFTQAIPFAVEAQGPLGLTTGELRSRVEEIGL